MKIKVSCVQMTSSKYSEKNYKKILKILENKKIKNSNLVCFPECMMIFSDEVNLLNNFFEQWYEKFMILIKRFAKSNKVFVSVGSIPFKKKNKKFFNRSILINPMGTEICYYDKKHLFDVYLSEKEFYLESKNYDKGKIFSTKQLPWGNLGMTICYDLRFPEMFRKLVRKGANFFVVPAAFTYTTGKAHWETLLRARAIENGCFVFAAAQCGNHDNGRRTFGNSMIIDPWGKILAKAGSKEEILSTTVDFDQINITRKKIPSTTHR